jgi:hypothetical protein
MVRRFAKYLSGANPRTEVLPQELLPHRYHGKPSLLYTDAEVSRLLKDKRDASYTIALTLPARGAAWRRPHRSVRETRWPLPPFRR